MVKKIILVFVVLIFLAGAGIAIFIATFDANKYKPLIVEKLEEATGSRAELGSISLTWKGGLALAFEKLALYEKKSGLSVKRLEESEEQEIYESYLNAKNTATSNLGELLKEGMLNLEPDTPEVPDTPNALPEEQAAEASVGGEAEQDSPEEDAPEIPEEKQETM